MKLFTAILILIATYFGVPVIAGDQHGGASVANSNQEIDGIKKPGAINPGQQPNQSEHEKYYLITSKEVSGLEPSEYTDTA